MSAVFTGGRRTQSNNVTAYRPAVRMIVHLKGICHQHQLHRRYLVQSNFTRTFFNTPYQSYLNCDISVFGNFILCISLGTIIIFVPFQQLETFALTFNASL